MYLKCDQSGPFAITVLWWHSERALSPAIYPPQHTQWHQKTTLSLPSAEKSATSNTWGPYMNPWIQQKQKAIYVDLKLHFQKHETAMPIYVYILPGFRLQIWQKVNGVN